MAAPKLYSEAQLAFIRKKYMAQRGKAKEIVTLVNAEFPELNMTVRQVHNVIRDRGWAKLRKKAQAGIPTLEQAIVEVQANRALALKDLIAGHQRVGEKIVRKGEQFVDSAETAKTLASAASAVKSGISIVREALGLSGTASVSHSTFQFNFARSEDSPFMRPVASQQPQVIEAVVVEAATEG